MNIENMTPAVTVYVNGIRQEQCPGVARMSDGRCNHCGAIVESSGGRCGRLIVRQT